MLAVSVNPKASTDDVDLGSNDTISLKNETYSPADILNTYQNTLKRYPPLSASDSKAALLEYREARMQFERELCRSGYIIEGVIEKIEAALAPGGRINRAVRVRSNLNEPDKRALWSALREAASELKLLHLLNQQNRDELDDRVGGGNRRDRTELQEHRQNRIAQVVEGMKFKFRVLEDRMEAVIAIANRLRSVESGELRQLADKLQINDSDVKHFAANLLELQNKLEGLSEKLTLHNLRLVFKWSREFSSSRVDILDLIQEASIEAMNALAAFDPAEGTAFTTYAGKAVKNHLGQLLPLLKGGRRATKVQRGVERATRALTQKLERLPCVEEIAEYTGYSTSTVRYCQISRAHMTPSECKSDSVIEQCQDPRRENLQPHARMLIDATLARLTARDSEIVQYHFGLDHSESKQHSRSDTCTHFGISLPEFKRIMGELSAVFYQTPYRSAFIEMLSGQSDSEIFMDVATYHPQETVLKNEAEWQKLRDSNASYETRAGLLSWLAERLSYLPNVLSACYGYRWYQTIEDEVQNVLTRLWERPNSFNFSPVKGLSLPSYLATIVTSTVRMKINRSEKRRERRETEYVLRRTERMERDAQIDPLDMEYLLSDRSPLSSQLRKTLGFITIGLDNQAIAEKLGVSIGCVWQHRHRIRERVGNLLV